MNLFWNHTLAYTTNLTCTNYCIRQSFANTLINSIGISPKMIEKGYRQIQTTLVRTRKRLCMKVELFQEYQKGLIIAYFKAFCLN